MTPEYLSLTNLLQSIKFSGSWGRCSCCVWAVGGAGAPAGLTKLDWLDQVGRNLVRSCHHWCRVKSEPSEPLPWKQQQNTLQVILFRVKMSKDDGGLGSCYDAYVSGPAHSSATISPR